MRIGHSDDSNIEEELNQPVRISSLFYKHYSSSANYLSYYHYCYSIFHLFVGVTYFFNRCSALNLGQKLYNIVIFV